MRVAIVTTGLSTGGAEMMLLKLLERADHTRFAFHVISLTTLGEIGPRIRALGLPVEALGMRRGALNLLPVARLVRRLRELRLNVVQTWMYHADLLGGVAARVAGVPSVVWGIRNSNLHPDKTRLSTRLVARLNAVLSGPIPMGIISCSTVARDVHVAIGYESEKITVIPNGFDLGSFRPDPAARTTMREELRLAADALLIGVVGRDDPQKNHLGLLRIAGLVKSAHPRANFVFAGSGVDGDNKTLVNAAQVHGLSECAHFLGQRNDMPRLMASLDVLASPSSFGEAFPNVIGEAMACGVPCAVTDVGDSRQIVGDTGFVVDGEDMQGLADAISRILAMAGTERTLLGERARERVRCCFDIRDVVRKYEDYYASLAIAEDMV